MAKYRLTPAGHDQLKTFLEKIEELALANFDYSKLEHVDLLVPLIQPEIIKAIEAFAERKKRPLLACKQAYVMAVLHTAANAD